MRGHSRLLWVLLWLALVGGVALAVTLDVGRLHDEASEQSEVSGLMFQVEAAAYHQRAAEQRALDDPARAAALRAEIARIERGLARSVARIDKLDPDSDPEHMAAAVTAYEQGLGAAMDGLDRHGPARARALDDMEVTPGFDRLVSFVERQAPREGEEAAAAQSAAQRRSVLSFLIGLIGVLAPLAAVVALRRRADRAAVREQLLHQSERRFRALVQNASDACLVVAGDGTLVAVHGPTAEVLGLPAEDLVGESLWPLVHEGDRDAARAFVAEPARSNGETTEWRVSDGDGSWRHLEVAAADLSDDPAVGGVVLTLRDVSRRKELEDQLRHRAFHDPLTHLPNRALFLDRAEHALTRGQREGGAVAALFIDLDDFKVVNDRLGHAVGDELLVQAARRLRACVRSADTAARLGGDEFGILVEGALSASEPVQVAERVLSAMREPFVVGADSHLVHASIGVAVSEETDRSADELMRRADLAMYAAKASGKSRYELFDVALERAFDGDAGDGAAGGDGVTFFMRAEELRAEVETVLARGDSPQIVMQPMLDLRTGLAAGYESLSRFPGSDRPPNAWFSQAHRYALGSRLEARALERALALPGRPPGTFLALNLSPSALVSEEVWSVLPDDLTGVVIEVTENELAFGKEGLEEALTRLRDRGARLAVDDAGAGYAGLKQLMHLDPDLIKLDRTIVCDLSRRPTKAALIEAIARYARRIGAAVCAEGVETLDDLRALIELDVTYAQGYAIARPAEGWPAIEPAAHDACDAEHAGLAVGSRSNGGPESGERILERIVGALSAVDTRAALSACVDMVTRDLEADEIHICMLDPTDTYLETVGQVGSVLEGTRWLVSDYPSTERCLREQATVQVLARDPDADEAEVELLDAQGIASMLMVPVLYGGRTVGLLEAYAEDERPWSRGQIYRARIIAYQLGAVLARLGAREAQDGPPERSPTLDEVVRMRAQRA